MKLFRVISLLVGLLLTPGLLSCKKRGGADATKPLQESFQTAEPEVKQAIETVNTSFKAGNYAEASRALAPVVATHNLTDPQRQAVGLALQQINQAVGSNPALDTKEMYDLRAKMFKAYDGGKRF